MLTGYVHQVATILQTTQFPIADSVANANIIEERIKKRVKIKLYTYS